MLSHFLKTKIIASFIISAIIIGIFSLGIVSNLFKPLHEHFSDYLYDRNEANSEIIIIAIDDKSTSLEGLGRFSQWSRERFTELLTSLQDENPSVITFDILFHTRTEMIPSEKLEELQLELDNVATIEEKVEIYEDFAEAYGSYYDLSPIDLELAEKFNEFDNIVLSAALNYDGVSLVKPLYEFAGNVELGVVNSFLDRTGILRKSIPQFYISSEDRYYDDIAVATVKKYLNTSTLTIPTENEQMLVNFFGDPYSYQMISFIDVVNGNFEPGTFTDKIVLIGATAAKELHDEYLTPRSNTTPMSGVEFRANEIQTILEQKFLYNQSKFSQILTIAGIAIGLTIIFSYTGIILSLIITALAILAYILAAQWFYFQGTILNMVYPFFAVVAAYIASWVYKYFIADKKKRELKGAFSHYVSEKLVEKISQNPESVKLGGEKRVITVFFSDIKNSTTLSEKTEITAWVKQMNEYFTIMESIIKNFGGTLDKYEGDAIMGFFNAPLEQKDHTLMAFVAALEMQKTLKALNQKWQKEGKPTLEFRIGMNAGEAIVGNFGSINRFDYTAMGDTVNTASRLESAANKTYGTSILVAGFEKNLDPEKKKALVMRQIDTVILPGKNEPVKIFELICAKENATETVLSIVENYEKGLSAYQNKDFAGAIKYFETLKDDLPSQIMLSRCQKLLKAEKVDGLDENMVFRIVGK